MPTTCTLSPTETILRAWLADGDLTFFCGSWSQGGMMELMPRGSAQLISSRYSAPFDGVRELRITGSPHHVHLDLRQLTRAWYIVSPGVCYGFRPTFELRFAREGTNPRTDFGLGIALMNPYAGAGLRAEPVRRYLRRAVNHKIEFPDCVSIVVDRRCSTDDAPADWACIDALMNESDCDLTGARMTSSPGSIVVV